MKKAEKGGHCSFLMPQPRQPPAVSQCVFRNENGENFCREHIVNRATFKWSFGALFIICLWLAGCAELAYQYMNDPSRDAW